MENEIAIPQKKDKPTGCLIMLHGTDRLILKLTVGFLKYLEGVVVVTPGDSGHGLKESVKLLLKDEAQLPHIKIVFPTAPVLPFSPFGGMKLKTWYDISSFSINAEENKEHIAMSAQLITEIINKEVSLGIPVNKIAIAGFSRGGAMSYYMGYSYMKELACVGVMSSWIPNSSPLREDLRHNTGKLPALFQTHGSCDDVIDVGMAKKSISFLSSVGVVCQFNKYPNAGHVIVPDMLKHLYSFIECVIPDI